MNKTQFMEAGSLLGWRCYRVNHKWTYVTLADNQDFDSKGDATIVEIIQTGNKRLNMMFRTRGLAMCPGRPGTMRFFRVITPSWQEVFDIVSDLFQVSETSNHDFNAIVEYCLPARRLIPETEDFYLNHRGQMAKGAFEKAFMPK